MKHRCLPLAAVCLGLLSVSSCRDVQFTDSPDLPEIFPDYIGVTVPESMTDLPFEMADGREMSYETERIGDTILVRVKAWEKGSSQGVAYAPFKVFVSHDAIDPYIAYRLIEPSYEGWKDMGIFSRKLSSFEEKAVVRNSATGGGCLNCHNFQGGHPDRMMFHARGKGGGTVFKSGQDLRLLNLTTVGPKRQGVYPAWHPDGRYLCFSSNATHQSFPLTGSQPIEVYDTSSDLILMDTATDSVSIYPPIYDPDEMETFPAWSPDGTVLYYCSAPQIEDVAENRAQVHYALKAVRFEDGAFSGEPWTLWSSDTLSVSFPRVYDNWLLFTVSAYGTFPIWHKEADLWLMDLRDGSVRPVDELNSDDTESYHSWSSDGRWVVFSSRRIDGRYTRLYFAHFDGEGHFSKPFLLPQRDPEHNTLRLKSYNIPEFVLDDPGELSDDVKELFGL